MTGQKERIIQRFEREAKIKDKAMRKIGMNCVCGKCNLAKFSLKEIKNIIIWNTQQPEVKVISPSQGGGESTSGVLKDSDGCVEPGDSIQYPPVEVEE